MPLVDPGSFSNTVFFQVVDDSGIPVKGLVAATMPTIHYMWAGIATVSTGGGWLGPTAIALSDLAAANSNWSSGGVFEYADGLYRLDYPNTVIGGEGISRISGDVTGKHVLCPEIVIRRFAELADLIAAPLNFSNLGITSGGHISNVDSVNGYGAGEDPATLVWAKAMTEPASVPSVTASVLAALEWLFVLTRNKITETSSQQLVRNSADNATIGTSAVSDDGTTFTRGPYS